jgi:hypothetical protein
MIEFTNAVLGLMKAKPMMRATKGVGQHKLRAGVDEGGVERPDLLRPLDIPQFGRIAGLKTLFEIVGASGTICENPTCLGDSCIQFGHGR